MEDFPVDRSPPARAGDTGFIPGPEDPTAAGQLSLCATTTEPVREGAGAMKAAYREPVRYSERSHRKERPALCNNQRKPEQRRTPSAAKEKQSKHGAIFVSSKCTETKTYSNPTGTQFY